MQSENSGQAERTSLSTNDRQAENAGQSVQGQPQSYGLGRGDIQAITESITQTVTASVLMSLKSAGLLPSDNMGNEETDRVGPTMLPGQNLTEEQRTCNTSISHVTSSNGAGNSIFSLSSSPAGRGGSIDSLVHTNYFAADINAARSGFVSSTLPLHFRVPMKTKEKIWTGEFVELSTLQDEEVEDITINIQSGKILTSAAPKRKFMSIEQWTDMFLIYSSVYRIKYPEQSHQLESYMGLVRKISKEGGAWLYYDSNFRKIRLASNLRFDQIENELYLTALSRKQQLQQPPFRADRQPSSFKDGFRSANSRDKGRVYSCNKYNKGSGCTGCQYPHICNACGGKHPFHRCWATHGRPNAQGTNRQVPGPITPSVPSAVTPIKRTTPSNTGAGGGAK
ncbi:MAG: hypothetical protein ABW185_17175 [Sedimenticola sp.]